MLYDLEESLPSPKNADTSTEKSEYVMRRYNELSSWRRIYEVLWDDITEYVLPSRGSWVLQNHLSDPERRSRRRFEATPIYACRGLTAKVLAQMTGTGSRWFDYRDCNPEIDKTDESRRFLQMLSDEGYSLLNNGSFRLAHVETTTDWVAYGTSCMLIEEIEGELVFKSIPPQEIFIAENKKGEVDTVIRKFKMTNRQIEQFFGADNLPWDFADRLAVHPDEQKEVLHMVCPNEDYKEEKSKNKKYMPFSSFYLLLQDQHILREGGYKRMPYIVARFWKRAAEVYGGSPAVDAMADIRMLNLMREYEIRGVQLEAWPALMMPHDSVILPLRLVPNGINFGGVTPDGKKLIHRVVDPVPGSRDAITKVMETVRQQIRTAFFINPLINNETSIRTAAEVAKRSNEEMEGIAPFLNRYEVEYLTPVLDIVLDFLLRKKGYSKQIPPILDKRIPYIEYTAPLAKTQRAQELNNILQYMQVIEGLAQVYPESVQHTDLNNLLLRLADLFGVPMDVVTPAAVLAQMKQQQMQQQQQAQGVQQLGQGGEQLTNMMAQLGKAGLLQRQDLGLPPADGTSA